MVSESEQKIQMMTQHLMIQQQMMQQQMMEQIKKQVEESLTLKTFLFKKTNGKITPITVYCGKCIEDLLNAYLRKEYGTVNKDCRFIHDGTELKFDDTREVIKHFYPINNNIFIIEK